MMDFTEADKLGLVGPVVDHTAGAPGVHELKSMGRFTLRDWAQWDLEHPYVPKDGGGSWDKGSPLEPVAGTKTVSGEKVTNAFNGPASMSTFTEDQQGKINAAMTSSWNDNKNFPGQTLSFDTTPEQLETNYRETLAESMKDPQAVADGSSWYSGAHDNITTLSAMSGIDPHVLAAGASVMSAGQKWEANVAGITALATAYAHPAYALTQADCDKLNNYRMTVPGKKSYEDAEGNKVTVPKFGGEGTFSPGEKLGDIMSDPLKGSIVVVGMSGTYGPGLGVMKGWDGVVSAVKLANMNDASKVGTLEVRPGVLALGGEKQRSFYNDIAFPKTGSGPTVDKWMQRAGYIGVPSNPSFRAEGASTRWNAVESKGPGELAGINGANVGPYPAHADAIRKVTDEYNKAHSNEPPMSSDTAQAIMWTHMLSVYPNGKMPASWK